MRRVLHPGPQVLEVDLTTRKLKDETKLSGKPGEKNFLGKPGEKNLVERLQRLGLQVQ